MRPFEYHGEVLGSTRAALRPDLSCRLSLLGLGGGGGGGLGLSGSATSGVTGPKSGGTITINNGGGGGLSPTTWLIIAGVALSGLLLVGIFFRGK